MSAQSTHTRAHHDDAHAHRARAGPAIYINRALALCGPVV